MRLCRERLALWLAAILQPSVVVTDTAGPLAWVSIAGLSVYSIARPCAAGCIRYNGLYMCEIKADAHDVGLTLGCRCKPLNACYCSEGYQSAATSYIQSCVSANCEGLPNADGDVTSWGSVVLPANSTATATAPATDRLDNPAATTASGAEEDEGDDGLSKSDIIALATGLGVGIPSLAVAAIALVIQLRRRRSAAAIELASVLTPSTSQTNMLLGATPRAGFGGAGQHVQAYELGRNQWR
ncbi:hypothetical protein BU26DRAFT_591683 [Trematosphaeria pertusa]|uniref:Extracellular membrane protein CFEM domain-containing protein n=1 Tax=Trematosphaeria pertusa TaxID=390896 RepID=A0A6A6IJG5_9PLEO|nr:uncharacterized protein BU26DRAFT_591683 [Trematosphaeria pertusa]KAF2250735.1 hypothetical protein BU26DRAFT_591683 [Trematosphaeria pertusa]